MYFLDTGLCSYIMRWPSSEVLERSSMDGAFFETWVVSEIYKSYINNGKRPPLYFYRDSNKKEIDLIIQTGDTVNPIEVKKSSYPKNAARQFSVLKPIEQDPKEDDVFSGAAHLKMTVGAGAVVCMSSDVLPIDKKNWLVPAWIL